MASLSSSKGAAKVATGGRRKSWKPFGVLALVGLGFFVLPTLILFVVGLAPTFVAYAVDRRAEKYAAFSVGCMNFCGVLPFALDLWLSNHTTEIVSGMMSEPLTWIVMYGAAGVGSGIHLAAPQAISVVLRYHTERRITKLREFQEQLVSEWGRDITKTGIEEEETEQDALPPEETPMEESKI